MDLNEIPMDFSEFRMRFSDSENHSKTIQIDFLDVCLKFYKFQYRTKIDINCFKIHLSS